SAPGRRPGAPRRWRRRPGRRAARSRTRRPVDRPPAGCPAAMTSARITALAAALSAPLRALSPLDRDVLGWWILTRLGLLLIGSTAPYLFGDGAPPPTLDRWRQWDFWHFDRIATHGYFEPGWRDPVEAFFPGLPLLLRAGFALGAPTVVIG